MNKLAEVYHSFVLWFQACSINSFSIEALLVKGLVLSDTKPQEARLCFQEAHNMAPHRFEPIKCMTDNYLAEKQKNPAATMANLALKSLGHTPRTLTVSLLVWRKHELI